MKDIDKMIKCRALYLQSIVWIIGEDINFDNRFSALVTTFAECYIEENGDLFDLIYDYKIIDNKVVFREEEEWDTLLNWYLKHYFGNFDNVCRLYDDIGYENVDKISKLASLFCNYLYEVVDMSSNRRIKH